ncbi:hypothetical protein [Streptacidiphilus cavernicola]|uniref:Aminoglycoside phosphotransferase domain-containing protein n=1 Tax=Streptacidiphilus cavernicola TaxID=3342716 RepID=A0ABV6W6Z4_9ACTN
MRLSISSGDAVDLRVESVEDVLAHVERALHVRFDRTTVVRKRRSIGAHTDRESWVRIERRGLDRIGTQGWNGTECAAALHGIAKPDWRSAVAWRDGAAPAMWRADETSLLPGTPIGTSVLAAAPHLSEAWWQALNASLDALAAQQTSRVATPDTELITQPVVTEAVQSAFGSGFDTTISTWVPAHADLNWANVSGPEFCLFDWEDWGNAPLGLDSASLWGSSLTVPALADRVRRERRSDLESRDGKLMTLFVSSKFAGTDAHPEDPRVKPARLEAARIVAEFQAR